ncbi:MAG TPA: hypothetical protein DCE78_07705 [Bacteroidetes bacterium]|nr:hypothetical protein [Bacteroidota bacterium]
MKKPDLNFVIDAGSLVSFLVLASTGILMYLVLPAGSGRDMVWGLTRHEWGDIHFWISMTFFALMGVHLILHWNWITCMVKTRISDKMGTTAKVMAVIMILLLTILIVAPLFSPVTQGVGKGQEDHTTEVRGH